MVPQEAVEFFGSRGALATVCDVTDSAVYYWIKQGWIPYDKQCLIQVESQRAPRKNGKRFLVASWDDIPAERRPEVRAA